MNDRTHYTLLRVAIASAIAALLYGAGVADRQRQEAEQAQYCQMVDLWRASKGDKGWPDYAGTYRQACARAGSASGSTGPARHPGARLP